MSLFKKDKYHSSKNGDKVLYFFTTWIDHYYPNIFLHLFLFVKNYLHFLLWAYAFDYQYPYLKRTKYYYYLLYFRYLFSSYLNKNCCFSGMFWQPEAYLIFSIYTFLLILYHFFQLVTNFQDDLSLPTCTYTYQEEP